MHPVSLSIRSAVLGCGRVRPSTIAPFSYQLQALAQFRPQVPRTGASSLLYSRAATPFSPLSCYTTASPPLLNNSSQNIDLQRIVAKHSLDWNSFFKLRASRRRYTQTASIVTALVSTVAGAGFLGTRDIESFGAQVMGLDPYMVLCISIAACGAAGWLIGPFFGSGIWGLIYRRYTPAVAVVRWM